MAETGRENTNLAFRGVDFTCAKTVDPWVFYALFQSIEETGRNFVEVTSAKTGKKGGFCGKSKKCGTYLCYSALAMISCAFMTVPPF